ETITFEKGGIYTIETSTTNTSIGATTTGKNVNKGTWAWGSSNKKKDQIILDGTTVLDILRLANDELVIKSVVDSSNDNSSIGTNSNSTSKTTIISEETKTYSAQ